MNEIDHENVKPIIEYFQMLPDPRHTRNRRHRLVDIIVIAVCGVIVGCEGPTAIERWAKAKEDWLKKVLKLPKDHPTFRQWPGVKAIGMAIRVCKKDGNTMEDRRYYIVSRYVSGKRFAKAVRGHWRIENSLHWQLDVVFREDESRVRQRRLTNNLAWLRRFAISLLKQHPSNHSIKGKAQIAGWNNDFLMQVLTTTGN